MAKIIKHTLSEYQQISSDAWVIFKKYFPDDADTSTFADDVHIYDGKYNKNPRTYEFAQKLMRVFSQELNELKELKKNGGTNKS